MYVLVDLVELGLKCMRVSRTKTEVGMEFKVGDGIVQRKGDCFVSLFEFEYIMYRGHSREQRRGVVLLK